MKTPMNNLYDPILLGWGHFVVARQAQTSAKDICADIYPTALYVGICAPSAILLSVILFGSKIILSQSKSKKPWHRIILTKTVRLHDARASAISYDL